MSSPKSHAQGVTVYSYFTYLAQGEKIVPVHSSRPATLELIESISAVPVLQSGRQAHPSEVCELGFLRESSTSSHAGRAN